MPRYRYALTALALLALSAITQPVAAAQDAAPDPARFAPGSVAPLTLDDFAGGWWQHGFTLGVKPDGWVGAKWRTYKSALGDGPGTEQGTATFRFDRVEGRTLYGTILTTSDPDGLTRGPFELTEYDYGIGVLSDARVLGARAIGAPEDGLPVHTLCGPRYADAPRWFTRLSPCGA